jgi:hypothetical protein
VWARNDGTEETLRTHKGQLDADRIDRYVAGDRQLFTKQVAGRALWRAPLFVV